MGEEKVKTQLKERKKGRAFYVEIAELDYARQGGWGEANSKIEKGA